ncbi:hypothetical protein BIU82_02390 [Arthrobacter sp. SW1]|nr:hypothetical protein BIU82_02390 [Arthrobacter sp. SW1]
MALGLVPAAISAVLLCAALVVLAVFLAPLVAALTPFADGWPAFWRDALRAGLSVGIFAGATIVGVLSFAVLTLTVGGPLYERIGSAVERELGDPPSEAEGAPGGWLADGASLLGRGLLCSLLAGALGLIPVVGAVIGAIVGFVLTAWLLAEELSSQALAARGFARADRQRLLRSRPARTLGFGLAAQAFFFVPLGAVLVMPVAVAGASTFVRSLQTGTAPVPASRT